MCLKERSSSSDFIHAMPRRLAQRRVDLAGLPRDALLRVGLHVVERAHVVEAVGELHQQDADVLRHVQEHLAKALGLTVLLRAEVELRELRDPVDEEGHLVAELSGHVFEGGLGVLDGVVEERGDDRRRVERSSVMMFATPWGA
jgi:hypothetical protein